MKLLTHNMLTSTVRKVVNGYPLKLVATEVELQENDFNREFVVNILSRVNYTVLKDVAIQVGYDKLPDVLPADYTVDEDLLKKIFHALLNINIVEGKLICPETSRVFPIVKGIPNMLLNESEL